jgi:predicted amidophosphoribosyltransferase
MLYALAKLFSPPRCVGCGVESTALCTRCVLDLTPPPAYCLWCRASEYKSSAFSCHSCQLRLGMASTTIVSAYSGLAQVLVRSAKFGHMRAAAEAQGHAVAALTKQLDVEVVTTVPTLNSHIRARGYDHATTIAKTAARDLGLPFFRMLGRAKSTQQVGKNRNERLVQAKNSVFTRKRCFDQKVLLIDDVVTTGATMLDCVRALSGAGAIVHLAAFASQSLKL